MRSIASCTKSSEIILPIRKLVFLSSDVIEMFAIVDDQEFQHYEGLVLSLDHFCATTLPFGVESIEMST